MRRSLTSEEATMRKQTIMTIASALMSLTTTPAYALDSCVEAFTPRRPRFSEVRPETDVYEFNFPGMRIGSITDPTLATGTTVFHFPEGAVASYDSRGGSVGAVEIIGAQQ